MIPISQTHAFHAFFESSDEEGAYPGEDAFVVAWSDQGAPMVITERGLVAATSFPNFHLVDQSDPYVVGVVPGGGWQAEYVSKDGTVFVEPVIAWTVDVFGNATPLSLDESQGGTDDATKNRHGFSFRRWIHPDRIPRPTLRS